MKVQNVIHSFVVHEMGQIGERYVVAVNQFSVFQFERADMVTVLGEDLTGKGVVEGDAGNGFHG